MTEVPQGHLYLGGVLDPSNGERTGDAVHLEASDLTTHLSLIHISEPTRPY